MSSGGWRVGLVMMLVGACSPRTPPPGSGAVETTPVGTGSTNASVPGAPRTVEGFPGGAVLDVDAAHCELRVIDDHGPRWIRQYPSCDSTLEAAIAPDSSVFVRGPDAVKNFTFEGDPRWSAPVARVDRDIMKPTTLRDSRLVVATSPREITVFSPTGTPAWRFALPAGETLQVPPSGLATEGVVLASKKAVYIVGSSGQLRFRVASNP